jgi:dipeptidyl-peptidase-4
VFWYEREGRDGSTYVEVDADARTRRELAAAPDARAPSPGRLRSPDSAWDLVGREGNVFLAAADSDDFLALTTDGEPDHGCGIQPGSSLVTVTNRRSGMPTAPIAVWSPDSSRILTHRLDQRHVPEPYLLDSIPQRGFRPVLHTYRMPFAGDPLATAQLVVIDRATGSSTPLAADPLLVEFLSPLEIGWAWWGAAARTVWFLREERGATRLALWTADVDAGTSREVIVESSDTYVEPHPLLPWTSSVRFARGDSLVVWASERDGRRHLYLFDAASGELLRRLTSGEWIVRDVLRADDQWVWFTGLGRELRRYRLDMRDRSGEPAPSSRRRARAHARDR